jgi:hypothetical protein
MFSFHSLRSGFLCNALLLAGNNESSIANAIHLTALVADWEVGSKVQMRYVKEVFKKNLISNRLIKQIKKSVCEKLSEGIRMPEVQAENPILDPSYNDSVLFHALDSEPVSTWTPIFAIRYFNTQIRAAIKKKWSNDLIEKGDSKTKEETTEAITRRILNALCKSWMKNKHRVFLQDCLEKRYESDDSNRVDYFKVNSI